MICVSNGSELKDMVAEEVSKQVDVTDMLGDGAIENGVDGGDIGASVGRRFGERMGRKLGSEIGREVHETVSEGLEEGKQLGEIRSELATGVRDAFRTSLRDVDGSGSLSSMAKRVSDGTGLEGFKRDETDTGDGSDSESDAQAQSEPDAASEDETVDVEADTAAEESSEEPDASGEPGAEQEGPALELADQSVSDLQELRRDTLEDFLGVLSYSDLQSIAKDVDVTANLSREEMTAEIIETVTGDEGGTNSEADAAAD